MAQLLLLVLMRYIHQNHTKMLYMNLTQEKKKSLKIITSDVHCVLGKMMIALIKFYFRGIKYKGL